MTARMIIRSAMINVMCMAAEKAGRGLVRDFNEIEHLQVSRKSLGDFVSTADHKAEEVLVRELIKSRPTYGFLVEESGVIAGEDPHYQWIIDPLDGTTNFLHGIPHFCISIALKHKSEIVAGVIYNPVVDELYWAEKGNGTYLNQRRLRVSGRKNLEEALIGVGAPFGEHGDPQAFIKSIEKVMPKTAGIRRFGAAALDLAFVAAGRLDGFFETHLKPWDMAAGMLMVKEAGGYVSDFAGGTNMLETGEIIAANEPLFAQLAGLVVPQK